MLAVQQFSGSVVVEVVTRKHTPEQREVDLAESLAFARLYLATASKVERMSPRGRRPGGVDTRQAIVEAARVDFAEQGYDGTSLRGIARRAEVDPALVHHYFGGKPQLFAAVMDIPADPAAPGSARWSKGRVTRWVRRSSGPSSRCGTPRTVDSASRPSCVLR